MSAGRRSPLVALFISLAMAVVGLPALSPPAKAADSTPLGQFLQWSNGNSSTTAGANATIMIDLGRIAFVNDCPTGFNDFVYPQADIYVVPAGSVSDGATLNDVSGTPNTTAPSGSLFTSELIGFTAPGGNIPEGTFAVVYDECQNGRFEAGTDALFDPALTVSIPTDVPPLPSIAAAKAAAHEEALIWAEFAKDYTVALNAAEVLSLMTGNSLDALMYLGATAAGTVLPDVKLAAIQLLLNNAKHWKGISDDPPDPEFEQPTTLVARPQLQARAGDPLVDQLLAVAEETGNEAALAEALLHSMERYQGADQAEDGDWALVHARGVRDNANLLAAQMERTSGATDALLATIDADPRDIEGRITQLEVLRHRIEDSGFTAEERAAAAAAGITDAELADFREDVTEQDFSGFTEAYLNDLLADLRGSHAAADPTLTALASSMGPVIGHLQADANVADEMPVVDAGGPYRGEEGIAVTFDGTGTTSTTPPTSYEWDLDGDGDFDDATGPTPSRTYDGPRSGLVGLRVTNDAGVGVGYAPVVIVDSDTAPSITTATPDDGTPVVEVGQTLPFTVTVTDAQEQPVTVTWEVDGARAATGTTFGYLPVEADLGLRTVEVVADDGSPLGGQTRRAWAVRVTSPDADEDGWAANVDCDDDDPAVNPGSKEVVGNGVDDDCDPATPDGGSAPTADITADPAPAVLGEAVTLDAGANDADGEIVSYQWNLGDGTTSTEPRPSHTYTAAGHVVVRVTVTDEQGDTATDTLDLTVRARPDASFTVDPIRPTPGEPATFTDTSTDGDGTITARQWDFGDGATSTDPAPTHTYAAPGTYTVMLTVTDDHGLTDTATTQVHAAAAATAAFTTAKDRDLALGSDGAEVAVSSVFSTSSSYRPTNLNDGSDASAWRSAAAPAGDQEVRLRLAAPGVVDKLVLVTPNSTTAVRDFELQLSDDGTTDADFTTVLTATSTRDGVRQEFGFPATRARHARLLVDSNHGATTTQISTISLPTRDREGGIVSLLEGGRAATVTDFSSESPNEPASRLIDGSGTGRWRTATAAFPQSATVALAPGRDVTVDRVVLTGGTGTEYLRGFEIQVATAAAPTSFTTVFAGEADRVAPGQTFTFPAVQAAHVRLVVTSNWGYAQFTRVGEMAVPDADGVNTGSGAPTGNAVVVAVSAQTASTPATAAIDASSTSGWQTPTGQQTGQLTVRLRDSGTYLVDRVDVQGTNGTTSAKDVEIQVSDTTSADSAFTTVGVATIPADARAHPILFPPVTAKYVRLVVTGNHGATSMRVNELRVWSTQRGGATVAFDDMSADDGEINSWAWQFGDGATSSAQHPVHTYPAPGTYPVTLTITDDDGLTSTASMDYTVVPKPVADFTWSPAEPGERVNATFTDTTTTDGAAIAWRWVSGVTSDRVTPSLSVSFPDNGTYPVTLHVTDSEMRTASVTKDVTVVNRPPTADAGPNRSVVWGQDWQAAANVGDPGTADATSLTCDWDFGDGQMQRIQPCNSNNADVAHSYAQPGTYTATLTVTDKDGAAVTDTRTTTVDKRPTFVQVVDARTGAGGDVTATMRLFDGYAIDGIPGSPATMSHGTQALALTTDGTGRTSAGFTLEPGTETVGATFSGNDLYEAAPPVSKPLDAAKGDIVFMIDESGSMGGVQDAVRRNLFDIARKLGDRIDFRIGIVGFGSGPTQGGARIHTPVSEDLETVYDALAKLTIDGGFEPGYHATVAGMGEAMGFRSGAGTCGVLIGDETPQWNTTTAPEQLGDAIAAAHARDAVMFAIVTTSNANVRAGYGPDPGSLTAETGGSAFAINTFANNPQPVLDALLTQCINRIIAPDLGVTIAGDLAEVRSGDTVTYTVTVGNDSSGPASGVELAVELPTGLELIGTSDGAALTGGEVRWPAFGLGAREQTIRTLVARVVDGTAPGTLRLTATVADDGTNGADRDVTDNTTTVDTSVLAPDNEPPVLAPVDDVTMAEGTTSTVALSASDPDGDELAFAATGLPAWATLVAGGDGTASIGLAPGLTDAGTYPVTVTVSDGALTADRSFTILVTEAPPVALAKHVTTDEDTPIDVELVATGGATAYEVTSRPGHGTLTGTAPQLTYTPSADFHGTDSFTYTASNEAGTSSPATVTIVVRPVNDAPVLGPIADVVTDEGASASIALTATDVDGDLLVFEVTGLPSWATFTDHGDGTAEVQLSPGFDDAGVHSIDVSVSDGSASDSGTALVEVLDVNRPPVGQAGGPYLVTEGSPVTLDASGSTDPDGDEVTFAWDLDGDGDFDDATGARPELKFPDDDTRVIRVRATDSGGLSGTASAMLYVLNAAPVIGEVAVSPALAGPMAFDGVTVTPRFTDAGVQDTHTATLTVGDVVTEVAGYRSGEPIRVPVPAGCHLPVSVVITDDDGGSDTGTTSVSAGSGAWMPPLRNDGSPHSTQAGQVIPVKVRFDDCTGMPLPDDLQPQIRVRRGDGVTAGASMTGPELTLGTVAASQQPGTMVRNGEHYHYNLDAELEPGTWTILVYPYGVTPGSPSLRHLVTIR